MEKPIQVRTQEQYFLAPLFGTIILVQKKIMILIKVGFPDIG